MNAHAHLNLIASVVIDFTNQFLLIEKLSLLSLKDLNNEVLISPSLYCIFYRLCSELSFWLCKFKPEGGFVIYLSQLCISNVKVIYLTLVLLATGVSAE